MSKTTKYYVGNEEKNQIILRRISNGVMRFGEEKTVFNLTLGGPTRDYHLKTKRGFKQKRQRSGKERGLPLRFSTRDRGVSIGLLPLSPRNLLLKQRKLFKVALL